MNLELLDPFTSDQASRYQIKRKRARIEKIDQNEQSKDDAIDLNPSYLIDDVLIENEEQ